MENPTPLKALEYPDVNWFDMCTEDFVPVSNENLNISEGQNLPSTFFHSVTSIPVISLLAQRRVFMTRGITIINSITG